MGVDVKNIALYQSEKYKSVDTKTSVTEYISQMACIKYRYLLSKNQNLMKEMIRSTFLSIHLKMYWINTMYLFQIDMRLNRKSKKTCYLEFASSNLEDVKGLK